MPWDEQPAADLLEGLAVDRLGLAAPLLGATGWIDSLARLVAVDTAMPPGAGYGALSETLQDMFAPIGFGLRSLVLPPELLSGVAAAAPRVNLVASRRTGRPVCTLHFHMDTPPAGPGWTRPPLTLTRQGQRLYGLGTRRMKGAIAAVWAALRAADAVGLKLRFDPLLLFTTDGGSPAAPYPGLRYLAEQGEVQGHLLSLDGLAAPRIWTGSPGLLTIEICIAAAPGGRTGEAARPILARLTALQDRLVQGGGGGRLSITAINARQAAAGGGLLADCILSVQRCCGAGETPDQAQAEIEALLIDAAQPHHAVTLRRIGAVPAVTAPEAGPNGARWQQSIGWGFGFGAEAFRPQASTGPSVLGFVQQAGIAEILQAGLQRPGQPVHGPDECTTIEDVEALARTVLAYLADVPGLPEI